MRTLALPAFTLFAAFSCRELGLQEESPLRAVNLRCEDRSEPLAIATLAPRFSWQVESRSPKRRGQAWTAFQLQVAHSTTAMAEGSIELWDSGWVDSMSAVSTLYGGGLLESRDRACWRVRIRDLEGRISPWSDTAHFAVGLLSDDEWSGDWIGAAESEAEARTHAPWLRRKFELPATPKRAVLHVASIGYHEVHVNGARSGDTLLAPSVSDLSQRTHASTYDLTDQLRTGANVLGLWLGPGWSRYPRYAVAAGPLVRAELDLSFADGSHTKLLTGPDWRAHPSSTESIGGWNFGDYGGERIDIGLDVEHWSTPDFDDAEWPSVQVHASEVAIVPESVEPNRAVMRLHPIAIDETRPGVFRVDMGRSFAGIFEAQLAGEPGSTVRLSFSERKDQDVTYAQRSELRLGQDGRGRFRHRFNYVTARWITIEGANRAPSVNEIRAYLVRSDYERIGSFSCSDPLLQRIYDTTAWTFECLSLGGYIVDCAHRERWGYGGDAHATMETALSLYGLGAFYRDWLDDWAAIQDEFGNLPFTCPTYRGGGGPAWSGIVVMLPWEIYRRTGDLRLLEHSWPTIERWLAFLETKTKDGLLQFYFDERYTRDVYSFLGDWVPPGGVQAGGAPDEKRKFFNNAYRVWAVRIAARIARATGRTTQAEALESRAEQLARSVHERFFDAERGVYVEARQTYYALPILAGIGTPEIREQLFQRLIADLEQRAHVDTGIHGTWFLIKLLLARYRVDLLHLVASQTDQPSWGYMLEQGATTLWEQWDGVHSRAHSSFLSIGAFFVEGLLGIRPHDDSPGYAHFELSPAIGVGGLASASGHLDTVRGRITCSWIVESQEAKLSIVVPVGTRAFVRIPTSSPAGVRERGVHPSQAPGIVSATATGDELVCEVLSGAYDFRFRR